MKISMTEYHHLGLINYQTDALFYNSSLWWKMSRWIQSLVFFHFFDALNDAFIKDTDTDSM